MSPTTGSCATFVLRLRLTSQHFPQRYDRRRRKSKKLSDDSSDGGFAVNGNEHAGVVSRKTGGGGILNCRSTHFKLPLSLDTALDGGIQSSSSSVVPGGAMSPSPQLRPELTNDYDATHHPQPPQQHWDNFLQRSLVHTSNNQSAQSLSQPPPPLSVVCLASEEKHKKNRALLKAEQESLSKFGLTPSHSLFFPYMALPGCLDTKRRGRCDQYPILDQLNMRHSPQAAPLTGEERRDAIPTTSPVYQLFDKHLGALANYNGNAHPHSSLQSPLFAAVQQASSYTAKIKKKTTESKQPPRQPLQQSDMPSPQSATMLVEELAKLYVGCMKQAAFLRQNMWNMENWCKDHLSPDDLSTVFDGVERRDVEWVLRIMMQQMKQRRHQQYLQQQLRTQALVVQRQRQRELLNQEIVQRREAARRINAPNATCLPLPDKTPGAPNHGGEHGTPVISVGVKVRGGGWRDKTGARLRARLWAPSGWKKAAARAHDVLAARQARASLAAAVAALDHPPPNPTEPTLVPAMNVSSIVSRATLEAVASELVRPDLVPQEQGDSDRDPPAARKALGDAGKSSLLLNVDDPLIAVAASCNRDAPMATTSSTVAIAKSTTAMCQDKSHSDGTNIAIVTATPLEKEKKPGRKRKSKDSDGDAAAFIAQPSSKAIPTRTMRPIEKRHKKEKEQLLLPHVPGLEIPRLLRRSATAPVTGGGENPPALANITIKDSQGNNNNKGSNFQQESERLRRVLHTNILRSDRRPSERRAMLAKEISASVAILEGQRSSRHLPPSSFCNGDVASLSPSPKQPPSHCQQVQQPTDHEIHERILHLQAICKEDLDIFPDGCNTTGMWKWLESSGYFEERGLENVGGLLGELEQYCLPLSGVHNGRCSEKQSECQEDFPEILKGCWGNFPETPSEVVSDNTERVIVGIVEEEEEAREKSCVQEPSPLFDRLQSLLVEVDEGSDEDDDFSNLPDFSPQEFIHGPNKRHDNTLPIGTNVNGSTTNDAMIDVSGLTLDQRTYIQLRMAGLVDIACPLVHCRKKNMPNKAISSNQDEGVCSASEIIAKMKARLTSLPMHTNPLTASLKHRALSHIAHAQGRNLRKSEEKAAKTRYERYKAQQKQRKKKTRGEAVEKNIRTSGRLKMGW